MTVIQERSPQVVAPELTLPDQTPISHLFYPGTHRWNLLRALTTACAPILLQNLADLIYPSIQPKSIGRLNVCKHLRNINERLKDTDWQIKSTIVVTEPGIRRTAYFLAHSD